MIAIGSDHGGVELKEKVIKHLQARGIECEDTGCYSTESCDYPVYAKKVTDLVTSGKCELGILICGTGIGMSMAANKVDGIRAALCHDCFSAEATKQHNNANVLCMGARVIGEGLACKIADIFIPYTLPCDKCTKDNFFYCLIFVFTPCKKAAYSV